MRKQAILSLFLLTILMGHAVAIPLIVPLIVGGIIGGGIGFWLGTSSNNNDELQKKIEELEKKLQGDELKILSTLKTSTLDHWYKSKIIIFDLGDHIHQGRLYAWSLAKYTMLKALKEGYDVNAAAAKARIAVYNYYLNVTKRVIKEIEIRRQVFIIF
jgi:hypothetical protein